MPVIAISMLRGRPPEQKQAVMFAVRDALRDVYAMQESSYSIRVFEFDPEDFYLPPPKTPRYLLVELDCFPRRDTPEEMLQRAFPSRDIQAKARLQRAMLENLAAAGEDAGQVLIVMREPPMENWGFLEKLQRS